MEKLLTALSYVKSKTEFKPDIAIVLGSGLGDFAKDIKAEAIIPFDDIPAFPTSTVQGHNGKFVLGTIHGKNIIAMQGRVHYYEGYTMQEVVMPIRLMGLLGAKTLILTNSSGGINLDFDGGDIAFISGQISSFVLSPLIGKNYDKLGERFPDMTEIYSKELLSLGKECAKEISLNVKEGVYAQLSGPQYESPNEVNMLRVLGADMVGMSTACEAIAGKHMGFKIMGISVIANKACGLTSTPLTHTEVLEIANKSGKKFISLLNKIVEKI